MLLTHRSLWSSNHHPAARSRLTCCTKGSTFALASERLVNVNLCDKQSDTLHPVSSAICSQQMSSTEALVLLVAPGAVFFRAGPDFPCGLISFLLRSCKPTPIFSYTSSSICITYDNLWISSFSNSFGTVQCTCSQSGWSAVFKAVAPGLGIRVCLRDSIFGRENLVTAYRSAVRKNSRIRSIRKEAGQAVLCWLKYITLYAYCWSVNH